MSMNCSCNIDQLLFQIQRISSNKIWIKLITFSVSRVYHVDGSAHDCGNSIGNALELLQSCTEPSVSYDLNGQTCLHKNVLEKIMISTEPYTLSTFQDIRQRTVASTFRGSPESVRDVQFSPHLYFQFAAAIENGKVQVGCMVTHTGNKINFMMSAKGWNVC